MTTNIPTLEGDLVIETRPLIDGGVMLEFGQSVVEARAVWVTRSAVGREMVTFASGADTAGDALGRIRRCGRGRPSAAGAS